MYQEKRSVQRAATFIIDLVSQGYINKADFMKKMANNKGEEFSENTFFRTKEDVEKGFNIPLIYKKKENRYEIDSEIKKKKQEFDSTFLNSFETGYKKSLSNNEMLIFYSFIKSMIESDVYLPPLNGSKETDYQNILRKLEKNLDYSQLKLSKNIDYKVNEHFKNNLRINFSNHINTIMDSFKAKRKIKFIYRPKNKVENEKTRIVQPVKLLHYTGKWYLIAYCTVGKGLRTFNLSYIMHSIKLPKDDNFIDSDLIPEPKYNESFGILISEETETAVIRFYGDVAERMQEVIWQKGQITTSGDCSNRGVYTQFEFASPKSNLDELVGQVLRFGYSAEIIGFKKLREKWIGYIREMNKKYVK